MEYGMLELDLLLFVFIEQITTNNNNFNNYFIKYKI